MFAAPAVRLAAHTEGAHPLSNAVLIAPPTDPIKVALASGCKAKKQSFTLTSKVTIKYCDNTKEGSRHLREVTRVVHTWTLC